MTDTNEMNIERKNSKKLELILGIMGNDVEKVKSLLEEGVDPQGSEHCPSLFLAATKNRFAIAKLLLEHGADPNVPEKITNCTPLMEASFQGHAQIVKLLLENGADIQAKSAAGLTALELATKSEIRELIREAIEIKHIADWMRSPEGQIAMAEIEVEGAKIQVRFQAAEMIGETPEGLTFDPGPPSQALGELAAAEAELERLQKKYSIDATSKSDTRDRKEHHRQNDITSSILGFKGSFCAERRNFTKNSGIHW